MTMADDQEFLNLIYAVIDEHNATAPKERQVQKAGDTILFGDGAKLDSLGLVSVIISVEERLVDDFGASVTIADERALSQSESPFRTIRTLAEYIRSLVQGSCE